jgi:hypothetical protein
MQNKGRRSKKGFLLHYLGLESITRKILAPFGYLFKGF